MYMLLAFIQTIAANAINGLQVPNPVFIFIAAPDLLELRINPKVLQSIKGGSGKKITCIEWCLLHLLSMPVYKQFFPRITIIGEVAA